jgi:hypothetical protein
MCGHLGSNDKRATPRYQAAGVPARLGWRVGDAHQTIELTLLDVSMGGLAAVAAAPPPAVSPLWISLPGGPEAQWVEVSVVAVKRRPMSLFRKRGYMLRMKFAGACPFEFFKQSVRGFACDLVSQRPAPDDLAWFNKQCWR